jgi:hypothetical protein
MLRVSSGRNSACCCQAETSAADGHGIAGGGAAASFCLRNDPRRICHGKVDAGKAFAASIRWRNEAQDAEIERDRRLAASTGRYWTL